MNTTLPPIRLSQGQLNLLEICPVQFQRLYLEQLATPIDYQQQEKISWGSQFHRLMQQQELGLSIDSLLQEEPQLQQAIAALRETAPELWPQGTQIKREAEHCRTLGIEGYLLTVVYDLLILEPNQAKILDWKTYLQPENPDKLAKNWQTRLYLYLLAQTSEYLPEQISMTYWFVKPPEKPQHLTFRYNSVLHKQTQSDLNRLLTQLTHWLNDYLQGVPFPHRENCETNCPYYQSLCLAFDKLQEKKVQRKDLLTLVEEIEEIEI